MNTARPILLWLFAIVGLAFGAEPRAEKKESFAKQVDAMLRSPWTEIHTTQALITDYGEICPPMLPQSARLALQVPSIQLSGTASHQISFTP